MIDAEQLIAVKQTTQRAPLEKLLSVLRTRRVLKYVDNKIVLDFGCGADLNALRAIGGSTRGRYGIDSIFKGRPPLTTQDGIYVTGSFVDLRDMLRRNQQDIDCILSLACFEHLEPSELKGVLGELHRLSSPVAKIIGTVPAPLAKPVLEFLSYKLGLIDPSQIKDHKVYYDRSTLSQSLKGTGWRMEHYKRFQLGMNSFFIFSKDSQTGLSAC